MKSHLLAFVVIILAVSTVKALRCYQCEYLGDNEFGNGDTRFSETCKSNFSVDCSIISDVCFKVTAEGQDEKGKNIIYTIRGCGIRAHFPGFEEKDKCEEKNSSELSDLVGYQLPDSFNGTVCLCSGDNCNSSSILKVSQSLMVIAVGIGLCTKFMGFY